MRKYTVKWSKEFVSGNLNGLFYDSQLSFSDLDSASRYVAFLHQHKTIPVESSSSYICHLARIVVE